MANGQAILISTVTTEATSADLVAWATVRDELGVTGSANIVVLRRYVSSASAAIVNYTNRAFVQESVLDEIWPQRDASPYLIPGGIEPVQLSRWAIVTLTTVIENDVTLVDGTDYRADLAKGQVHRLDGNGYPCRWPAYALSFQFDGGYATVPADIQDVTIRMVRNRWNAKDRDPSLMSENIPGVRDARWWIATGNEAGNMPPDVQDVLDNYRVPVVTA
jgi:hypothetical protein